MRARGFTLLELLVAMAVLAVLGTLGFRGLNSVLDAEARLQAEARLWNDVSLLFSQLGEDTAMAVERTVRDSAGRVRPPVQLRSAPDESAPDDDAQLVISRLGTGDGAVAQSAPRRIGYRLRGGRLEYLVWPALDAAPGATPAVYPILDHVADVQLEALDFDGRWSPAWPAQATQTALPRAIQVRVVLAGGEDIFRILPLR